MSIFTFLRSFKWGAVLFFATVLATAETSLWHVHEGRQVRVDHISDEGVFVRSAVDPQRAPFGGMLRLEGLSREVALKGLFVPRMAYFHAFSRREEDLGKSLFNVVWPSARQDWVEEAAQGLSIGTNAVLLAGFFEGDALHAIFWSPLGEEFRSIWHGRHNDLYPRETYGRMPFVILAYDLERGVLDLGGSFPEAADFARAVWMDDPDAVGAAIPSRTLNRLAGRGGWELSHWVATVPTDAAALYLREGGINPRRTDSRGLTLLHHAAISNNLKGARELLQNPRTRIDATDEWSIGSLAYAASAADEPVLELLLEAGASPINTSRFFACPLRRILNPPREEMAEVFLRYHPGNRGLRRGDLEPHLISLISLDQAKLVRVLGRYGPLPLDETYGEKTPIAVAAGHASVAMLELFVEKGITLEPKLPNGMSLLHLAAASNARVIPWLVAQGLDPNAVTEKGENPLFVALRFRNVEAIIALLAHGADPNSVDSTGEHLLWLATRMAQREAVTHMVEAGAECDFTPETALALMEDAFRFDIPEVFEISLAQCLEPGFVFPGGFSGWAVAGRYGAERVQEAFIAAGLKEEDQVDLVLDHSAEARAQIQVKHAALPPYPLELQRKYGEQRIRVDVIIDREGRARFPIMLDNPVPELADEFLDHFRAWRFQPLDLAPGVLGVRAIIPLRLEVDEVELRVYETGEIGSPPRAIMRTPPRLPVSLYGSRFSGEVIVGFVILRDGSVDRESIEVVQASHAALIDPVLEAVRHWRFQPGVIGDQPVNTRVRQRIPFQLN